jgi:hypothetical protein
MSQQRMNKEFIRLQELIIPKYFRTVENLQMQKSPREITVIIELKDAFRNRLSFPVAWDGILYGFALETPGMTEFCVKNSYLSLPSLTLTFEDWDDIFCLTAEYSSDTKKETSYYIPQDDVLYLLENCRRISSQRIPKK